MRDALMTLGNLHAVLRAASYGPMADELEELRRGLSWLREAFAAAAGEADGDQRVARASLDAFAAGRVAAIEAALAEPLALDVADVLARATAELDAAAALLELAERAADPAPVEVSIRALAEQAVQLTWAMRSPGAVFVAVRASAGDCAVSCDPHVVARLLAIAVAEVRAASPAVAVRTDVQDDAGVIEVTAAAPEDAGADLKQARVILSVPPTAAVLAAAARAAGHGLTVEPGRVLLRFPRTS